MGAEIFYKETEDKLTRKDVIEMAHENYFINWIILKTNVEVIGATAETNNYVVYTAVKIPNKNIITCFISVIDVRYTGRFGKRFTFEITKKDMDESVGPCHYNPSKEILDLLTPNPSSEYAKEWRDKCYDATKTLQSDCQNI